MILRDPTAGVPVEVREGLKEALGRSLNIKNRPTKANRLGFSTSEDAVTWTVFAFLARHAKGLLRSFGRTLLGIEISEDPRLLLWGVPLDPDAEGEALRDALIGVLDGLRERRSHYSEPDVVIDFGNAGVVVIEVKLGSQNAIEPPARAAKFDRYVLDTEAYVDPAAARSTGLYELARNWRIAWDLAAGRPCCLANLGPAELFDRAPALEAFEAALRTSPTARFVRLSWSRMLGSIDPLPPWLERWLDERGVMGSPSR